ncbi:MAG: hypothetical protein AB7L13_02835 [Acidimicrobiia bacterium]
MAGAIVIVVVLAIFPILVGMSTVALAGIIGALLKKDGDARNEGSELLDYNY